MLLPFAKYTSTKGEIHFSRERERERAIYIRRRSRSNSNIQNSEMQIFTLNLPFFLPPQRSSSSSSSIPFPSLFLSPRARAVVIFRFRLVFCHLFPRTTLPLLFTRLHRDFSRRRKKRLWIFHKSRRRRADIAFLLVVCARADVYCVRPLLLFFFFRGISCCLCWSCMFIVVACFFPAAAEEFSNQENFLLYNI